VLRIREPQLPRPFRVPGGIVGVCLLAVPPSLLLSIAAIKNHEAVLAGMHAPLVLPLLFVGPCIYLLAKRSNPQGTTR
jgi:hypothetical protein